MNLTVDTRHGRIEGLEENGLGVFRGIPFAASPVGELRFRAPALPEAWSGVREARRFGPSSPQNPMMLSLLGGFQVGEQDEDCLYLNVTTPGADDAGRPVMVWIHGGGFMIGSGSQEVYDASPIARRGDVVVVTINYRLGALGFLRCAEIGADGNAGLHDQVAALHWVRDNIERFGGDPNNVTIFGESAGGMSVGALLGAPATAGLFRRAIAQSGAAHNFNTGDRSERIGQEFLADAGISAAGLRGLSVAELLAAQGKFGMRTRADSALAFQPTLDGDLLPRSPLTAVREGSASDVSLLIGTNRDEWKLFGGLDPAVNDLDESGLMKLVESRAPAAEASVLVDTYRQGRPEATPSDLFFAIETDRVFRIPAIRLAEAQRTHSGDVYKYLVTWESPAFDGAIGACHAVELPFVFGTLDKPGIETLTGKGPEANALSALMMDAWLRFAKDGNPSHEGLPDWPAYDGDVRATMVFGTECEVRERPSDAERAVWDALL